MRKRKMAATIHSPMMRYSEPLASPVGCCWAAVGGGGCEEERGEKGWCERKRAQTTERDREGQSGAHVDRNALW